MALKRSILVIGVLAVVAAVPVAVCADLKRKDGKNERGRVGIGLLSKSEDVQRRPSRMNRTHASSAVGAAAGVTICPHPASNCQSPDTTAAITSDRNSNFLAAEDFTPQQDGSITQLCWRGAYWNFGTSPGEECPEGLTDHFQVTYFQDDGGVPGTLMATFSQTGGTLTVTGPVATGGTIAGGLAAEYEYTATHAAVNLVAGQCYWIEISNGLSNCSWLWEASVEGNGRSLQDGDDRNPADGYDHDDLAFDNLMFCLDVPLGDSAGCVLPPPSNNTCEAATPIAGDGSFPFDSFSASMTGPNHDACLASGNTELDNDVWYCWTADCDGTALAWTCDLTDVDTKIAVYDGCGQCPPTDESVLACNDDRCDVNEVPRQSLVRFNAVAGQSYLIRLGTYLGAPGGTGTLAVGCSPPDHANCPGAGNCCSGAVSGTAGCSDEVCCERVCICDPFCCEVEWVPECSADGFQGFGCGAELLCEDTCTVCGNPTAGDCCVANGSIGCSDAVCCETVCAEDPFCCEVDWDENCATHGFGKSGNGAADLCPDLCGVQVCPEGPLTLVDPPDGIIDARQPHPPSNADLQQGIDTVVVQAPAGADDARCWKICHTAGTGATSEVTGVVANGNGEFTLHLSRPLPPGARHRVTYAASTGRVSVGVLVSHPGNVNGDAQADARDIETMIDCCLNKLCDPGATEAERTFRCDIDRSGEITPADLLREIDVLNGADQFDNWLGTPFPEPADCPQ